MDFWRDDRDVVRSPAFVFLYVASTFGWHNAKATALTRHPMTRSINWQVKKLKIIIVNWSIGTVEFLIVVFDLLLQYVIKTEIRRETVNIDNTEIVSINVSYLLLVSD